MRTAVRHGAAFLIAQGIALLVYSALILVALLVARGSSGSSVDAVLDRILNLVRP